MTRLPLERNQRPYTHQDYGETAKEHWREGWVDFITTLAVNHQANKAGIITEQQTAQRGIQALARRFRV